jgi:hypothetical protein
MGGAQEQTVTGSSRISTALIETVYDTRENHGQPKSIDHQAGE